RFISRNEPSRCIFFFSAFSAWSTLLSRTKIWTMTRPPLGQRHFAKGAADIRTPPLCPQEGETPAAANGYMGRVTYPANIVPEESADDWATRAEAELLAEALQLAPADGWTWEMAYAAGAAAGFSKGETELVLPAGPRDLAALWSRACDRAA